ncbi:hypothetical protein [uncultured Psychrobacter sp.]|uniref:hypothetical protein n=1 Tax=uncultured Psychrobacter sp. TaxID=259303 RepID=UPI0025971007|nr:hypothetical protein [uncultured Psychrobacter sp.]
MNIKLKLVLLTSVVAISMLLNACNITSRNQVTSGPIDKVAEQSKIRIDWSKIDSEPKVQKDNGPREVNYPQHTIELAKAVNRPVADIYRHQTVYDSQEVEQVLDKIKTQLGDSYVDIYGNGQGMPKYFIVTRQNVAAESYEYVVKTGEAKGFSIDFEILPIADRSKEAMLDVYDSEKDIKKIEKIIKKYGGEMQGLGFTPVGFKITIDSYFEKPLTPAHHAQMESELKQLTGVNIEVRRTGRVIF